LIVEPHTAGDPMQEDSYWTHLSQAEIADTLGEMGTPVSQPTAGRLLEEYGFAKRQIEKTIAGGNVPERNQQFEIIDALKQRYFDQKNPVFSIDTKNKGTACEGVLFDCLDTVVRLMRKTATQTGLSTTVHVIKKLYQTKRKATKAFRQQLPIQVDSILPNWNYTAIAGTGVGSQK
jgi:hypothetical protein